MNVNIASRSLCATLLVLLAACGNWFVDDSTVVQAKARAARPGTSFLEQAKIFDEAGDASVVKGQMGFASEMYFNAALNFDAAQRRQDVLRVQNKCHPPSEVDCQSIQNLIVAEWHDSHAATASAEAPRSLPSVVAVSPAPNPTFVLPPDIGQAGSPAAHSTTPSSNMRHVTSSDDRRQPPVACMVLRNSPARSGYVEFYNGCSFPVTYSFCAEQAGSPYDCRGERTGRGTDSLRPGASSEHFPGARMNWVACRGGPMDGVLAILAQGQARCE